MREMKTGFRTGFSIPIPLNNMLQRTAFSLIFIAVAFLLLCLSGIVFPDSSVRGESPPEQVEEHYDIALPTPTSFNVTATYDIYNLSGVDAHTLRLLYGFADAENKTLMEDTITGEAQGLLDGMLNNTFLAVSNQTSFVELDIESLTYDDSNDTEPVPIVLRGGGSGNFTLDTYGLPDEAQLHDLIYGALKMGAIINIDTTFGAALGHNRSYSFTVPAGLVFHETSYGYNVSDPATVFLEFSNYSGAAPSESQLLKIGHVDPNPPAEADIRAAIVIDRVQFNSTEIRAEIAIHSVDVSEYGDFSQYVSGMQYVSADGIRLAMSAFLDNWQLQEIQEEVVDGILGELETALSDALNTTVELTFEWDNSSLEGYDIDVMGTARPVFAWLNATGAIEPQLFQTDALSGDGENGTLPEFDIDDLNIVKGFLNAGGKANFTIPAMDFDVGITPEIRLFLSPGMRLDTTDATEEEIPDSGGTDGGGGSGVRYGYAWNPAEEFNCSIYSTKAPHYDSEKVFLNATIDMYETDVNWLNIESSRALIRASASIEFYRMKVPDEVLDELGGSGIYIEYINADVIRLLVNSKLMGRARVEEMIGNLTSEFEEQLSNALNKRTKIKLEISEEAFGDVDVENMDDLPVIRIAVDANLELNYGRMAKGERDEEGNEDGIGGNSVRNSIAMERSLSKNALNPQSKRHGHTLSAAPVIGEIEDELGNHDMKTFDFEFPIEPIGDWDISFTFIMPTGVRMTKGADTGGRLTIVESDDGRDMVTLRSSSENNTVFLTIGLTPLLIYDVCGGPVLIFIFTGLIYMIVRRRRRKKQMRKLKVEGEVLREMEREERMNAANGTGNWEGGGANSSGYDSGSGNGDHRNGNHGIAEKTFKPDKKEEKRLAKQAAKDAKRAKKEEKRQQKAASKEQFKGPVGSLPAPTAEQTSHAMDSLNATMPINPHPLTQTSAPANAQQPGAPHQAPQQNIPVHAPVPVQPIQSTQHTQPVPVTPVMPPPDQPTFIPDPQPTKPTMQPAAQPNVQLDQEHDNYLKSLGLGAAPDDDGASPAAFNPDRLVPDDFQHDQLVPDGPLPDELLPDEPGLDTMHSDDLIPDDPSANSPEKEGNYKNGKDSPAPFVAHPFDEHPDDD